MSLKYPTKKEKREFRDLGIKFRGSINIQLLFKKLNVHTISMQDPEAGLMYDIKVIDYPTDSEIIIASFKDYLIKDENIEVKFNLPNGGTFILKKTNLPCLMDKKVLFLMGTHIPPSLDKLPKDVFQKDPDVGILIDRKDLN